MKKSNIAIIAILVVASIVFLSLWFALGFNVVDSPLDLVLAIVWWVIIIAICVAIHRAEQKRQQATRIVFVADDVLFNSEAGIVPLRGKDGDVIVAQIRETLNNLQYDVADPEVPNDSKIRFKYIVRSPKFSNNGAVWEGEVVTLSQSSLPQSFSNERELARMLG